MKTTTTAKTAEPFRIENRPSHVAIIMDGNRRFAKQLNLDPWKGHEYGEKKFQEVVEWCKELDIKELTLYAFSVQNFDRPKKEFEYIMNLFKEAAARLLQDKKLKENDIRIRFIGRTDMFQKDVQELMRKLEDTTKNHKTYKLNFAMAYGGREEIIDAIKKLIPKIKSGEISPSDIDERLFSDYLYLNSEPDLVIRTGGERRTSNFLIWQTHYSEWIFLDKKWPEFSKQDFIKCIEEYSKRDRRIGK